MEDQPSSSSSSASSSSSSAAASTSRDTSGGAAASVATTSSSNASQVREEEDDDNRYQQHNHFRHPELEQNHEIGTLYGGNVPALDEVSTVITDDTWSCIIVLLTFWFFVSMTLILGVYGSSSLELGPNTSILMQPNPFFVQSIKVQELNVSNPGPVLYGFYSTPPLDTATIWSEMRTVSVPADSHTARSQISISYSVNSPSSSVFLIIAQGSGMIEQDLSKSSTYYVSVGNMNADVVEGNVAVLTTPGTEQDTPMANQWDDCAHVVGLQLLKQVPIYQ
ncbi:hypothetical protein C1H46_045097 [Malus baccata]|uniref:E3 ubiquitin-protein ligase APD1-4 N-terminal domain-containing protein n=1 Tax=Malus baccata TaxID=106549 RepID=A0A540K583_MALBA|nr:hypothetical protein C1H46_045097 [Malus baccata]